MKRLLPLLSVAILGCTSTPPNKISYNSSNTFNYADSFEYDSSASYSSLYAVSQKQLKTTMGYHYFIEPMMAKHNYHWNEITKKCNTTGVKYDLNLIVVLNANGKVINVGKDTELDIAKCFEAGIKTIKYPEPPFKNFYFLLNVYSKT